MRPLEDSFAAAQESGVSVPSTASGLSADAQLLWHVMQALGARRTEAVLAHLLPERRATLQHLAEAARLAGVYADLRHSQPKTWSEGLDGALIGEVDGRRYAVVRFEGRQQVISDGGEAGMDAARVLASHPLLYLRNLPEEDAARVLYAALRDRARKSSRVLFGMSLVINAAALTVPFFSMAVYGRVLGAGAVSTLPTLLAGALIVLLAMAALRHVRSLYLAGEHARFSVVIDSILMKRLLRQPVGTSLRPPPESQRAQARQAAGAAELFAPANMMAIYDGPFVVLTLIALILVGGVLALVPMIVLGLFLLAAQLGNGGAADTDSGAARAASARRTALGTLKTQARHIRRRGLERVWVTRFDQLSRLAAGTSMRARVRSGGWQAIGTAVGTSAALATLVVGLVLALEGRIAPSVLIGTMLLTWRLTGPAQAFYVGLPRIRAIRSAWERLHGLLLQPTLTRDCVAALPTPEEAPSVEANGLFLRYDRSPFPALSSVSFKVEPGQVVAVIGANGAGKSTLLQVLAGRLRPQSGNLFLAGKIISQYDPDDLALSVETLGLSKLAGNPELTEASEAEREMAEWTHVTEREAPLYILDSPLAIGGEEARHRVEDFLARKRGKATVFLATHDTELARAADVALVLDNGAQAYFGPIQKPEAPAQSIPPMSVRSGEAR